MKTLSTKATISGFTLIELLVVICVIAVFAAILSPSSFSNHRKVSAPLIHCLSNQRQIAIGILLWKQDHGGNFPWQITTASNGTMESSAMGDAAPDFNALLAYLPEPRTFVCPTDNSKIVATNLGEIHNQNISYYVNLDAGTNDAVNILTGDRHLRANRKPVKPGLFVYSNTLSVDWTLELHNKAKTAPIGVVSFSDGHGETIRGANLNSIFQRQGLMNGRLVVP